MPQEQLSNAYPRDVLQITARPTWAARASADHVDCTIGSLRGHQHAQYCFASISGDIDSASSWEVWIGAGRERSSCSSNVKECYVLGCSLNYGHLAAVGR
jgi:hypothetical protein